MQKNLFKKPTRRDLLRDQREDRERRFGHRLDSMDVDELLRLCKSTFHEWPRVFGQRFTPESARNDVVLRRLLLFALQHSPCQTEAA